jgi:hypothetical protein
MVQHFMTFIGVVMRFFRTVIIALTFALMAQSAGAADPFTSSPGACMWHQHNQIMNQSADIIRDTVAFNYENARTLLSGKQIIGSSRPAFVWAMETNNACAIASGYIKAGNYNAVAIQKCDCFHTRMLSYR